MSTSTNRRARPGALPLLGTAALLACPLLGCLSDAPGRSSGGDAQRAWQSPPMQRVFTSTAQVRSLAADDSGGLWAATGGGVLHWDSALSRPRLWTVADGLPSNDALKVQAFGGNAEVVTPEGDCLLSLASRAAELLPPQPSSSDGTATSAGQPPAGLPPSSVVTAEASAPGGEMLAASATGLWRRAPHGWQAVPLPEGSPASHVSALLATGGKTYAALYGDGLYMLNGLRWKRIDASSQCRDVTALAKAGGSMVMGTSDHGVLARTSNGKWTPLGDVGSVPLPSADIESIAVWHGCTWLATFDHGLLCLPDGSGNAVPPAGAGMIQNPRELVASGDTLYCRDSDSRLYAFDGKEWKRPQWASSLARPEIYCCASSPGGDTYVGGWGGWASRSGSAVTNYFNDSALAGQEVTCIAPDADTDGAVWLGTQGKGLLRYEKGAYTEFHEAEGLTDDWITSICAQDGRVLVGTYTGGLLELRGSRFVQVLEANHYAIRAICIAPDGTAYAATPLGVYAQPSGGPDSSWQLLDPRRYGGAETQCLCLTRNRLWIGARTSLGWIEQIPAANSSQA